jgi:hypothetical protein
MMMNGKSILECIREISNLFFASSPTVNQYNFTIQSRKMGKQYKKFSFYITKKHG